MTREEWLRHAVEQLNTDIFNSELDLLNHDYQIACGRCPGKKLTETIQPSDNEDIGMDDFFPTTIHVNFTIKDPIKILSALTVECVVAFFNIKPKGKQYKETVKKYGFEYDGEWVPKESTKDTLRHVYERLVKQYGEFPGKPIKFPVKQKEKKVNSYAIFCPECGYELKITKKIFEKHGKGLPTCPCGAKMGVDMSDDKEE